MCSITAISACLATMRANLLVVLVNVCIYMLLFPQPQFVHASPATLAYNVNVYANLDCHLLSQPTRPRLKRHLQSCMHIQKKILQLRSLDCQATFHAITHAYCSQTNANNTPHVFFLRPNLTLSSAKHTSFNHPSLSTYHDSLNTLPITCRSHSYITCLSKCSLYMQNCKLGRDAGALLV
jgi:hypothetical protein